MENKHRVEEKTHCFKGMKIIANVHDLLIYLGHIHYN